MKPNKNSEAMWAGANLIYPLTFNPLYHVFEENTKKMCLRNTCM